MCNICIALGIEYCNIEYNADDYVLFDNYATYGGGGKRNKNGHYGCKHTEDAKKRMSEMKRGKDTWNKGKSGYSIHNTCSRKKLSMASTGEKNPRALLTEKDVIEILIEYNKKENIDGVGEIQKNGIPMSYMWAFCLKQAMNRNITAAAIKNIIIGKTWKNVGAQYRI